jgi:hypothetical protein
MRLWPWGVAVIQISVVGSDELFVGTCCHLLQSRWKTDAIVYSEMVITNYNTAARQHPEGGKPYLSLAISTPSAAKWEC